MQESAEHEESESDRKKQNEEQNQLRNPPTQLLKKNLLANRKQTQQRDQNQRAVGKHSLSSQLRAWFLI